MVDASCVQFGATHKHNYALNFILISHFNLISLLCNISCRNKSRILKYPIQEDVSSRKYFINASHKFPTVSDLIQYYRQTSIKQESHVTLKEPFDGWKTTKGEYGIFVKQSE